MSFIKKIFSYRNEDLDLMKSILDNRLESINKKILNYRECLEELYQEKNELQKHFN